MSSGYYAACAGLVARTEALDTVANNLANTNTPGFRASHNVFRSMLASANGDQLTTLNQDVNDYGVLSGTRLDTSQGALTKTGNDLDVAIEGSGYFAVQTAAGEMYTRNGGFHVSPKGQLQTSSGDAVLGDRGPITIAGQPVEIASDGTISVDGAVTGRLKVVEFSPDVQLESAGGAYYSAPSGSATAAKNSQVQQGMLESSNANPITGMVELISAQREVEGLRRALTLFSSEMDKTAAQDLPRVNNS